MPEPTNMSVSQVRYDSLDQRQTSFEDRTDREIGRLWTALKEFNEMRQRLPAWATALFGILIPFLTCIIGYLIKTVQG